MKKNFYVSLLALLITCGSVFAQKSVVFVTQSEAYNDSIVIDAIASYNDSSDYTVTVLRKNKIDQTDLAQLNAADVVILGRNIPSGDVRDSQGAWDSITSPVLSMNMWGMRSSRAKWTPSASCANVTSDDDTVLVGNILMPDDPAFDGVAETTIDWWSGQFSIFGADKRGDDSGNGILLAQTADGSPLFMRWAAGVEYYPGVGKHPFGPRSYIGNGADSDSLNYFGFTDATETIFFNELALLANDQVPAFPDAPAMKEVVFVTQADAYNDSIVIDAIASYMDSSMYNVTVLRKNIPEQSDLAQLNAADVVIMGRNIPSGDVKTGAGVWDSITAPVLSMNMWGMRSSRAMWTPSASCANITSSNDTILKGKILMSDDPAFSYMTSNDIDWWSGQFSIFGADARGDDAGNGVLLAETTDGSPLFMRWEAGKEYYPGVGKMPMGPRSYIGNGADSDSINYFGFTSPSRIIFFNELSLLANDMVPAIPEPDMKDVIFVTKTDVPSLDSIVIDAIAGYMDSSMYNVTVLRKSIPEQSDLDQLNAADVVIIGRNIGSSDVGSAMGVYDSITKPVICMNMWGMRGQSSKAYWTPSTSCLNVTANEDTVLLGTILTPDDAAFKYMTSNDIDWWSGNFSIFGADAENDDFGNGKLLAATADGSPLFIRWQKDVEFYPGAGHMPMGPRSYIGNGSDANDVTNYFGFTDASSMIFFNELALMASGSVPYYEPDPTIEEPSDDSSLSGIAVDGGALNETFDAATTSYTVAPTAASVTITGTATDDGASVTDAETVDVSAGEATVTITVTAEDESTTVYTVVIAQYIGINNLSTAGIEMYPNPVETTLTLKGIELNSNIYILNAVGQVVYQGIANNAIMDINTNNLSKGIYVMKVETNGNVNTSMFIKK